MPVVHARCCGLDSHKALIVACRLVTPADGPVQQEVRTFGTMPDDLLRLADWLAAAGVTHVAMESTGVYWKPIYTLLEDQFALLLVNAQHLKAVPGRKTDVQDAVWLADLLRHGLVRASLVPDRPQRELRELTRYRTTLVRERAAKVNRLQKTLAGANVQLACVASDVTGVLARAMLAELVAGQADAAELAQLAKGRLRAKRAELERALSGRVGAHQRFLLAEHLAHLDYLEASIERVSAAIAERLRPFEAAITRLDGSSGVGRRVAEGVLAECGLVVDRFPTAGPLASWAGLCPGQHARAGKRRSGKTRPGSPWLRSLLVEAAQAAGRTKGTSLGAQHRRLAARRGKKRAAIAVAHSILVIASHLLTEETDYQDLGGQFLDQRDRERVERRLVQRLEGLGYKVTLEAHDSAA
jgi:transposase